MTSVDPICIIHGWDFSSIVYANGIEPSGGGTGVEEITSPARNYADIRYKGRNAKKYKITARSQDRDEIETFLQEVNTAPIDSEFYPFDSERFGLIALAHATLKPIQIAGDGHIFYEAEAEITCREPWLYGPDKGLAFPVVSEARSLPAVTDLLVSEGQERAPITYMQASGDYVSGSYVEDLSCRITLGSDTTAHDREIQLCEKMLRGDVFELGWRGEVWHSYMSRMTADLPGDIHTHIGGHTIAGGTLALASGGYFWIPFYGPLPISGEPGAVTLELWITAVTGTPTAFVVTDFVGYSPVKVTTPPLVIGYNKITIPDCGGIGTIGIGLWCEGGSDSITLSKFIGTVKRYVAPSVIPWSDPGESFKIRVESSAGTYLRFLQIKYNDRYYY